MEQPPIHHKDDCDGRDMPSWAWENIFAVAPGAGQPPGLGVNFMRATQHTINVEYALATVHGNSRNISRGEERAMLTLGQDLGKLGLGAVVWDCVSVGMYIQQGYTFIRVRSMHLHRERRPHLLARPSPFPLSHGAGI